MLVPDIDVDQLRGKIKVAVPVVIPEVRTQGAGNRQGVDLSLGGPRMEHMRPVFVPDIIGFFGVYSCNGSGLKQRWILSLRRLIRLHRRGSASCRVKLTTPP